ATVYGSPSISQPPSHASNSPNGRVFVPAPRREDEYAGRSILLSRVANHDGPASSITTCAPACVSACAAMPPPAPEPTIQTSYTAAILVLHLLQVIEAGLDRRERIGRLVVLDERMLDVRAVVGVVREDLREVDRPLADLRHRVLRPRHRVLHVHKRDAAGILLEVRQRIGSAVHHPIQVH